MLLTITISTHLTYILVAVIICSIALVSALFMVHGHEKYKEGLILGQSLYDGKPIELDKTWLGSTFWIWRVFKQIGDAHSKSGYAYLLEASNHLESDSRLFIISETEYKQLILEGTETLGKEYEYTSKVSHPGHDIYYFQRCVGMHDGG